MLALLPWSAFLDLMRHIHVDPLDIMVSCKTIIGVVEGACNPSTVRLWLNTFPGAISLNSEQFLPQLIELFKQGKFPVDKLGKIYPASSIDDALQDLKKGLVWATPTFSKV